MLPVEYYRGGNSLKPKPGELYRDRATGLVLPIRGVSVFSTPDNLDRFGGPHRVANVPPELRIVQRSANPLHFEILPAAPMTPAEYQDALDQIVLLPVQSGQ
jgi:hypothetical protein